MPDDPEGQLHERAPLREAAPLLIAARLADVREEEPRVLPGAAKEPVHRMRVATRRLRAALRLFAKGPLRALEPEVKRLQDALGAVRDLQLQLEWLAGRGPAARRALEALLRARLEKRVAALERAMSRWAREAAGLERNLAAVRRKGRLGGGRMRRKLREQLRELAARAEAARDLQPDTAHALRLAAKRLRYAAELSAAALPDETGAVIEAARSLQDAFGALHDADVRVALLRKVRGPAPESERRARERLATRAGRELRAFSRGAAGLRKLLR